MKNKGFSLVELIVVIAIMAILVGVAVPVYTSYISSAQKSKDIQMVDEIKHAVEIAAIGKNWANEYGITQDGTYIGAIVLKPNKGNAVVDAEDIIGTALNDALVSTFGSDYASKLTLSYDEWEGSLSGGNLLVITGSSYQGKTNLLMNDVQSLTNALQDFFVANKEDLFSSSVGAEYVEFLKENGIIQSEDDFDGNTQAIANAATLFVAESTTGEGITEEEFVNIWAGSTVGQIMSNQDMWEKVGVMPAVAAEYARAEALINTLNCTEARAVFQENTALLGKKNLSDSEDALSATSVGEVTTNILSMIQKVNTHMSTCNVCDKTAFNNYNTSGKAQTDAKAYYAMLGQVKASDDKVLSNIENSNLYAEGELCEYVGSYMSAAEALSGVVGNDGMLHGELVVVFTMNKNGSLIATAYPLDYIG